MNWTEMDLKDCVARDPSAMLNEPLLIINREIAVGNGGFADFVAVDSACNIVIVEAKVGRVKEEVFSQAIGYASVVDGWTSDDLARMYHAYYPTDGKLAGAFRDAFHIMFGKPYDRHSLASRIVLLGRTFAPGCISMADFFLRRGIVVELVSYETHPESGGNISFRRVASGSAVIEHAASRNLTQPFGEKRRTAVFEDDALGVFDQITKLVKQKLPNGAFFDVLPLPDAGVYVYYFWGGTVQKLIAIPVKRMKSGGLSVRTGSGTSGTGTSVFREYLCQLLHSDQAKIEGKLGNAVRIKDTSTPLEDLKRVVIPEADVEAVADRVLLYRQIINPYVVEAARQAGLHVA